MALLIHAWPLAAGWAACLLAIGGVFLISHLARRRVAAEKPWPGPWPRTTLIIPVKGLSPTLAHDLQTYIDQDHPAFQVIFSAEGEHDPAWPLLEQLAGRHAHVRLAAAGLAEHNGQKNHNLLAALAVTDEQTQVLAFSDAGHRAPSSWLRNLTAPVAAGRSQVASGFHHTLPQRPGLALLGRAACVLWMFWGRHVPLMAYPWGGSTAMTREAFERLDVAGLWSDTVVDDVTLGRRMREHGLRVTPCPAATLATPSADNGWASWLAWLERQLIYIKLIEPGSWAMLGLAALLILSLTLAAGIAVIAFGLGTAPALLGLSGAAYLALLGGIGFFLRTAHPEPGPAWAWLPASLTAMVMVATAFALNLTTNQVRWGGITYQVGRLGRVKAIRRQGH